MVTFKNNNKIYNETFIYNNNSCELYALSGCEWKTLNDYVVFDIYFIRHHLSLLTG